MASSEPQPDDAAPHPGDDPYAPFVPRRGRFVALGAGVAILLTFTLIALLIDGGSAGFATVDRFLFLGLGLAIAGFMARYASIRATVDEHGIVARNLLLTRDIPWSRIESVKYANGDPWPYLILDDTEQVAVMAIQRSDGVRSRPEVGRLVALARAHQGPLDPDIPRWEDL